MNLSFELEAATLKIYPDAIPNEDFLIVLDSKTQEQVYASWNKEKYVEPTTKQLQDVWFEVLKERKNEEFKLICEAKIVEGFTSSNGHYYRTNDRDQSNMMGRKEFLRDNPHVDIVRWKTEDIGYIEHTREDWLNKVYYEALGHIEKQLFKYDTLKNEVMKCEDVDQLQLVKWE